MMKKKGCQMMKSLKKAPLLMYRLDILDRSVTYVVSPSWTYANKKWYTISRSMITSHTRRAIFIGRSTSRILNAVM